MQQPSVPADYHLTNVMISSTAVHVGKESDEKQIKQLPDILRENLDMVVIGIAPSSALGASDHHFSGPGNHFWRCITEVGLVPVSVTCDDDHKMLDYGIGFISFSTRSNKGSTELSRKDIKAGAAQMIEKIKRFRPKIVVFNGIGIYEAFVGNKNFSMGLQPNKLDGTDSFIFVMPSSSARCAQLPRAEDKIPFFIALKKLRDHIKGLLSHLEEKDVVFQNYTEFRVTQPDPRSLLKAERRRKRKAEQSTDSHFGDHSIADENPVDGRQDDSKEPQTNKLPSQNDTVVAVVAKEEKYMETTITPSAAAMATTSTTTMPIHSKLMTSSGSLLSWPTQNGLTIIHTGQPIIMPTTVTQTNQPNTFLLFDPNGFALSAAGATIPVPVSHPAAAAAAQMTMRHMVIATDAEAKVTQSTTATSTANKQLVDIASAQSATSSTNAKMKSVVDSPRAISIKCAAQVTPPESSKPIVNLNPSTVVTASSIQKVEQTVVVTSSLNMSNIDHFAEQNPSNTSSGHDKVTDVPSVPPDPVNEWDLFMKGINTGDFHYPAPPQATSIDNFDVDQEMDELSHNTYRTLTVL